MRIYEVVPGRLPDLHKRFRDHALRLFENFGIRSLGYWTTYIGPSHNTLTYILIWNDLGERQRLWDAFQSDPEWMAIKAESEKSGPLIARAETIILKPTDYSPLQ